MPSGACASRKGAVGHLWSEPYLQPHQERQQVHGPTVRHNSHSRLSSTIEASQPLPNFVSGLHGDLQMRAHVNPTGSRPHLRGPGSPAEASRPSPGIMPISSEVMDMFMKMNQVSCFLEKHPSLRCCESMCGR